MSARQPVAGDVLAGRYRLVAPLGKGGMGAVWRAEHLVLSSPVAVKLIHEKIAHAPEAQARFLREAQAAAALRTPHVVQILDHGVQDDVPFIVMELLEGESLAARLSRQGALSVAETALVVSHVARAIQKAHEAGIVHRDLKPDNVFLVVNGDAEMAKVLDFGIAKVADGFGEASAATHTGAVLGTPHYMSPEQARGTRQVDHRSDLWSLGVIAFVCLTGRRPFESETLGDLLMRICAEPLPVPSRIASVPPGFDAWFLRATERDPERRFQSAAELAESFRQLAGLSASGIGAASLPPPSLPTVSLTPARASSGGSTAWIWIALAAVGAVAAIALVAIGALLLGGREAAQAEVASPTPSFTPAVAETPAASPPASENAAESPRPAKPRTAGAQNSNPSATAKPTPGASGPADELSEAQAKIKAAEQKVKEAEAKIKAAEGKLGGAGTQ